MRRPSSSVIVLGQFVVVLAANGALLLFRLFPRDEVGFLAGIVGVLAMAVSTLVVVGHIAWRPTWRKSALGLGVLLGGALASLAAPSLNGQAVNLFFRMRATQLTAVVRDLDDYGRIHEMSDGLRHFKSLNGELVAFTAAEVDTSRGPDLRSTVPIARVFARDGIDQARYEQVRQQLIAMRLIGLERTDAYVAFLHDGTLDNLEGLLYVRPGRTPPALETELFDSMLVRLKPLQGGWYWFATT